MTAPAPAPSSARPSPFGPLREPDVRRIWAASLLSNFGYLILGVGAAWHMTRTTGSPTLVALVQSALMLPLMLVSVPAGAIADMFDRRKVALTGLGFACICATTLTLLTMSGLENPFMLLGFCVLIGVGGALYSPAWQASVREQVSPEHLPAAIGLASISYNIARSFGPAVGGLVVAVAGAGAAFATNALGYLPLILAFFLWRRKPVPSRLPPERLDRAIAAGARYVFNAPSVRTVMLWALSTGVGTGSIAALLPIIARDMVGGGAGTYGLLLGCQGAGAVVGALLLPGARERFGDRMTISLCAFGTGVTILTFGFSHMLLLAAAAIAIFGAAQMVMVSILNLSVQMSVPRWVTARALSWYQSALTGGIAVGAWLWGDLAGSYGIPAAMTISGCAMLALPLLHLLLPLPRIEPNEIELVELAHTPEVALALTPRSGPIVIEVDHHVDPATAREFYMVMMDLHRARRRNGARNLSLARNIADPTLWTERYHFATWNDYFLHRERQTKSDLALQQHARSLTLAGSEAVVRRMLERPFGSVRWRSETPDPGDEPIPIYAP